MQDSLKKSLKRDNIIYETPKELAIDIINLIDFEDGDVVLDPCKGETVHPFYDNFPANVTKKWCEILLDVDFLQFDEPVDWIIGNPPFGKLLTNFIEHSASLARKGIIFIIPTHSYTYKRIKILGDADFHPYRVYLFTCWFGWPISVIIFKKGYNPIKKMKYEYKSPYDKHNNGKV